MGCAGAAMARYAGRWRSWSGAGKRGGRRKGGSGVGMGEGGEGAERTGARDINRYLGMFKGEQGHVSRCIWRLCGWESLCIRLS